MEKLKQKINYHIHLRNTLWTTALIIASGTLSLIFRLNSFLEKTMFIIGFILTILLFNGCFKKEEYIENLINKLEDKE